MKKIGKKIGNLNEKSVLNMKNSANEEVKFDNVNNTMIDDNVVNNNVNDVKENLSDNQLSSEKVSEKSSHIEEISNYPLLGRKVFDVETVQYYTIYKVYKFADEIFLSMRSDSNDITCSKVDFDRDISIAKLVLVEEDTDYVDFKEAVDVTNDIRERDIVDKKVEKFSNENETKNDANGLFKEIYNNALKDKIKFSIDLNLINRTNMKSILKIFSNKDEILDYIVLITINDNINNIKEQLKDILKNYYLNNVKK